ncbi:MAG: DnaD domain protein [Clostridia bacterium]|nr:DnaD domain protein [Clostridia bacterium]
MKLTFNYGQQVVVLPLQPLLARADQATRRDLKLLFVLAADTRIREDYAAEADRVAAEAGVTRAQLDQALRFWQGAGVIDAVLSEEDAETEAAPAPKAETPKKHLARADALPEYTTDQLSHLLETRTEARSLIDAAQQTCGRMFTTMEVGIVLGMLDALGLEEEYILTLLAWCTQHGKKSVRYAEKMAIALCDEEEIRDAEALNRYLRDREAKEGIISRLRTMFGADARSLTQKEKNAITRWLDSYGYGEEIIARAYEITVNATTKPSIPYADSILTRWHSQGITTLEEIDADARARGEAQSGTPSSFDTDEYFEDALKRSYS